MFDKIKKFFEGGPFGVLLFLATAVVLLIGLSWLVEESNMPRILSHSDFMNMVEQKNVSKIKYDNGRVEGRLTDNNKFEANVHMTDKMWDVLKDNGVEVIIGDSHANESNWYILAIIIIVALVIIAWFGMRRSKNNNGGASSLFSLGKSRFKKTNPGEINTRFSDVAGAKMAKEALSDIIEFLKNPARFKSMGARIPKGVLLSGEPGNGKTLLARAVAGEANCTFLSISGADFIEVFVGVGAARIRDLFAQARKNTPCILFIDEIDAIGRSRGTGIGGGHDEREQTLNQLLTEMDGFDQYEQPLVILAATNMPEVLDKALLRPGRFDRVIYVSYPDYDARLELLKIHTAKVPLGKSVILDEIAAMTQGLSGADVENFVNMAALQASRVNRKEIEKEDFEKAYKDILSSKRDIQLSGDKAKEFLPQQVKTKFSDIAGLEDAKDDLKEIVDFLKNPDKYIKMGARIPRGVMMSGDPGNGKTLLARAVAGEAAVPFFYASGSQFIQKYVGVGAERIRDLFTQARKHAPSIIFIDELDSLGKRRSLDEGGSQEYTQTINQLLTEMDGFIQDETPVVVIAATNTPDDIDKALLRPGRFDRHISIPYPNLTAREKILQVHARGKKFDASVDLKIVAKGTSGFSGAKLEQLLNESAILAVALGKDTISMAEIDESRDRLMLGKKNATLIRSTDEITKTAYHEAGHALLSMIQKDYPYQFYKVTVLSRGGTLGVSHSLPVDDMTGFSKEQYEAAIVVCLGGRVAESMVFNHISTGARGDFMQATKIAKDMVIRVGMGDTTGIVSYEEHNRFSPETGREIDLAIRMILDRCMKRCEELLLAHRALLEKLAISLIEHETLTAKQAYEILGLPNLHTKSPTLDNSAKKDGADEKKTEENSNTEEKPA